MHWEISDPSQRLVLNTPSSKQTVATPKKRRCCGDSCMDWSINTTKQTISHHSKPRKESHAGSHYVLMLLFHLTHLFNEQRKICIVLERRAVLTMMIILELRPFISFGALFLSSKTELWNESETLVKQTCSEDVPWAVAHTSGDISGGGADPLELSLLTSKRKSLPCTTSGAGTWAAHLGDRTRHLKTTKMGRLGDLQLCPATWLT